VRAFFLVFFRQAAATILELESIKSHKIVEMAAEGIVTN